MKSIFALVVFLFPTTSVAGSPVFNENTIKANCTEEWGSDFQMVAYCVDKQREGFRIYTGILGISANGLDLMATSFDFCQSKWEPDWAMVKYCADRQIKAVPKLQEAVKDMPIKEGTITMRDCIEKWKPDYTMAAYCTEQQAKGWARLNGG